MLRSVRLWAPVSSLAQHATAGRVRKMTDTTSNGGGKHDEGGPQSVPTGPPSTISNAAKIVDVQGGQLSEAKPEEGQLPFAERAKNIIVAAKRFQLVTYNKLPGTKDHTDAVFSDPNLPVRGAYHAESNTIAVLLREQNTGEKKHMENVAKITNASLGAGHIDPPKLLPVFTRIGLMPPTVRVVGDLVQAPPERVDTLRNVLRENLEEGSSLDGDIYQLECGGALFADITPERTTTVPARDFRMAEIDPTAKDRNQAIEYGNTQFLDDFPAFCRDILGVPVEEAYMYSLDRAGFSVLGLRDGSQNKWREYRFPFAKDVEMKHLGNFVDILDEMKREVEMAAKKAQKASLQKGPGGGKRKGAAPKK